VCVFEVLGWLLILISLAGIRSHTWCLITVGAIGLIHNAILANLKSEPKTRNLPLKLLDTILTHKIMDGLMDLEETHEGCGEALLQEFFPGRLRPDEEQWWKTKKGERSIKEYDQTRLKESVRRGHPRSMLPKYNLHATSSSPTSTRAPDFEPRNAIDQSVSTAVTPAQADVPTLISIPGRKPLEPRHHQSTRAESNGLPAAGSVDPSTESQSHGGAPAGEEAEYLGAARRDLLTDNEPTLEGIAKKMPKRPYWD
jgi:hypothetical protein